MVCTNTWTMRNSKRRFWFFYSNSGLNLKLCSSAELSVIPLNIGLLYSIEIVKLCGINLNLTHVTLLHLPCFPNLQWSVMLCCQTDLLINAKINYVSFKSHLLWDLANISRNKNTFKSLIFFFFNKNRQNIM